MKTFCITADFRPTIEITARVEPYNEDVIDATGFLALEGAAGLFLLEDGVSRIFLKNPTLPLTADSTIYTADDTTRTADQTFILDVS